MPDPLNNSFIPKRGPSGHSRVPATRQVYIFTMISYTLIFATLIATGGTFLYEKYLEKQLDEENALLYKDIGSFNNKDMEDVLDFDRRLQQANDRLNSSASVVSVFDALEESTAQSVKIDSLELERVLDDKIILSAEIKTDTFDAALFQRKAYGKGSVFNSVVISELDTSGLSPSIESTKEDDEEGESEQAKVSFKAELEIPLANVPFKDTSIIPVEAEKPEVTSVEVSAEATANNGDEEVINETNI